MAVQKELGEKQMKPPANGRVAFAKLLAGNDKKIRDKGLKKLKKWLLARSSGDFAFTEDDLMVIWVGLFYSMWMSDLPLVQEELAESLSSLVHCFNQNHEAALLFIKCFNKTMDNTWLTLDQFRIDKFSMLVRRFLRQSLVWLAKQEWPEEQILNLMDVYKDTMLAEKTALGLKLQFIEVFLEELAKVSKGELKPKAVVAFCSPFARAAAITRDGRVRLQLEKFFRHLIKQTDLGLEYEEKFDAWRQAGCPGGDVNAMELVPCDPDPEVNGQDESDDEQNENLDTNGPWDPRAGSVHVTLPQIKLPPLKMAKMAKSFVKLPTATLKGKKMMLNLRRQFRKLDKGKYPYTMKKINKGDPVRFKKLVNDAVKKSVRQEVKQFKKRAERKKKLKKLNKKRGMIPKEEDSKPVEEKTSVQEEKVKKRKRKDDADESPKTKKPKTVFAVSDVPPEVQVSPVGAKKLPGASEPELELPPGWIVESAVPKDTPAENGVKDDKPSKKLKSPEKKKKEENNDSTVSHETNGFSDKEQVITIKNPHSFFKHALEKVNKVTPVKVISPVENKKDTPPVDGNLLKLKTGRRISFNLQRNMAQAKEEYFEQLQRSPQIPFDASLTPKQSALKPGLPQSPINPFYERLLKIKK